MSQIEKIFGKPLYIEKKDVYLNKKGEFRHYTLNDFQFPLQIDYYKGKATAFYLDLPEPLYSDTPEDIAQMCGFKVTKETGNSTEQSTWWKDTFNRISFSLSM